MPRLRLSVCLLVVALLSFVLLGAQQLAAECCVTVVTDRADALYEVDGEVAFLISVTDNDQPVTSGKVSYVLSDDGAAQLAAGTVELGEKPSPVLGTMSKPGFLQCKVTFEQNGHRASALAGAGVSPERIEPSLTVPDDFDAYWNAQKEQLATLPMNARLTPLDSDDTAVVCFDVRVDCLGGAPVSGYLARPEDAKPKSLPAVLWVHGAGVYSASLDRAVTGARHGMLSMDINAHGIANGKPQFFYDDLKRGALNDYSHRGRDNRETCYFRGMYLRLVRAIDFLCAQPEWDEQHVIVCGHSQGGGQSLAAAGLDARVTAIAVGVPAMCDHTGGVIGRTSGWPKLVPNDADGKPNPTVLEVSRYFDAVNFAARTNADAIMSVGFIDVTCPPTTNYAAYNQLRGKKEVINEPRMGHAAPPHIHEAFLKWIDVHVKETSSTRP